MTVVNYNRIFYGYLFNKIYVQNKLTFIHENVTFALKFPQLCPILFTKSGIKNYTIFFTNEHFLR